MSIAFNNYECTSPLAWPLAALKLAPFPTLGAPFGPGWCRSCPTWKHSETLDALPASRQCLIGLPSPFLRPAVTFEKLLKNN